MTAGELHDVLAQRGACLMVRALAALERGSLDCTPQAGRGRHLREEDRQGRGAHRLRQARARGPQPASAGCRRFPGAWFEAGAEGKRERIKVLRASARRTARRARRGARRRADSRLRRPGAVRLIELQRAGKKPMRGRGLLRGFPLPPGTQLKPLAGALSMSRFDRWRCTMHPSVKLLLTVFMALRELLRCV